MAEVLVSWLAGQQVQPLALAGLDNHAVVRINISLRLGAVCSDLSAAQHAQHALQHAAQLYPEVCRVCWSRSRAQLQLAWHT